MWTTVENGKFEGKGKTLPQIIVSDPDWFFWMVEQKKFRGKLAGEAELLAKRAKAIKFPSAFNHHAIQHMFAPGGVYAGFNVVEKDRPPHLGSSTEVRSPVLDLSFPRSHQGYDKTGNSLLLKTFKYHWFGGKSFTKKSVEAFFDDKSNFVNP